GWARMRGGSELFVSLPDGRHITVDQDADVVRNLLEQMREGVAFERGADPLLDDLVDFFEGRFLIATSAPSTKDMIQLLVDFGCQRNVGPFPGVCPPIGSFTIAGAGYVAERAKELAAGVSLSPSRDAVELHLSCADTPDHDFFRSANVAQLS